MKHWLLLTVLLIPTLATWADAREFVREYTYVAGEADSKISARQMAMQEVKRELLNEIGTHIYSRVVISVNSQDGADAKQEIRAMTAGFVKVDVLEEKWDGYKYYINAKMTADPEEILKRIKELASNDEESVRLKYQLNQSSKAFEDLRLDMLALKKSLEESKSDNDRQNLALAYAEKSRDLSIVELFNKGQAFYWGYMGESINYFEAKKWYQKAADKDFASAQYNLALMYANGQGVQQDNKQALYWYQRSADQGLASAQYNLARLYFSGQGVQQDYRKAVYWYQKAAGQGNANAQFNLAHRYGAGQGVQKDSKQAVYWYQKAADQGHADAQYLLGFMYNGGIGVQKDYKQAAYWFLKAAAQGIADAQYNLAYKYANGQGVQQDNKQALYWFQQSAAHGHKEAINLLRSM